MLTKAFRSAPASVIAPFEYTALIWGVMIDWLVWDTLPTTRSIWAAESSAPAACT